MDHRHLHERSGAFDRLFVVLRQTTRPVEPSEGPFDDPPLALHHEAFLVGRGRDDFQDPHPSDPRPRNNGAIRGVHPNEFGEFDVSAKLRERRLGPFSVLHRRRRNHQRPDQPERIDDHVPLAAVDFFSPRRSLWARLARWSSRFDCPGRRPSVWALCLRPGGRGCATDHGCGPTSRPIARTGSSETRSGTAAGHEATRARRRRCASDKGSH
jgi:hypothetical protein